MKSVSTIVVSLILKLSERYALKIVQEYAPTSDHVDYEVEEFYDDTVTHFILCGDFNAKIGRMRDATEISLGNFVSGRRNERGATSLNFLLKKNLFQMISFFYKKNHRKWTCQSPEERTNNKIDFIISDKYQIFTNQLDRQRYRMIKEKSRST